MLLPIWKRSLRWGLYGIGSFVSSGKVWWVTALIGIGLLTTFIIANDGYDRTTVLTGQEICDNAIVNERCGEERVVIDGTHSVLDGMNLQIPKLMKLATGNIR